jgi:hypothetical protein
MHVTKLRRAREREMQMMLEARYNCHVFIHVTKLRIAKVWKMMLEARYNYHVFFEKSWRERDDVNYQGLIRIRINCFPVSKPGA